MRHTVSRNNSAVCQPHFGDVTDVVALLSPVGTLRSASPGPASLTPAGIRPTPQRTTSCRGKGVQGADLIATRRALERAEGAGPLSREDVEQTA